MTIKISAMTAKAVLDGTEELEINDSGTTRKATAQAVSDLGYFLGQRIFVIGDSLAQYNSVDTTAGGSYTYTSALDQRGPLNWLQAIYNHPFTWEMWHTGGTVANGGNKATSGDTLIAEVLPRISRDLLNRSPDVVWLMVGTNDINASYATVDITTAMLSAVRSILATGAKLWISTVLPRHNDDGNAFSGPEETVRGEVNTFIRALPDWLDNDIIVFDGENVMGAGGVLSSDYSEDGIHLNAQGAQVFATDVMSPALRFTAANVVERQIPTVYNAGTNPYGNLLPNQALAGTGGSVGTGVTGDVASSWNAAMTAAVTGISVVATKETRNNWNGDSTTFQGLEVTSTALDDDREILRFRTSTATTSTGVVAGEWYVGEVEVSYDAATSGSNILRSVYLQVTDETGTWSSAARMFSIAVTTTNKDYITDEARSIILRTPPIRAQGTTGLQFSVRFEVDGQISGVRKFYVGEPVLRPLVRESNVHNNVATRSVTLGNVTNDGLMYIPRNAVLDCIVIENTTANAVTGGVNIGTSAGGAQIASAFAVGANAHVVIDGDALLLRYFSRTARQAIYWSDVTAWNSANLNMTFVWKEI